jgi:hypothetical protein
MFDGFDGDVDEGTPLLSAAMSSRRFVTVYAWSSVASEPPAVPAPDAAQPSSGASLSFEIGGERHARDRQQGNGRRYDTHVAPFLSWNDTAGQFEATSLPAAGQ